MLVQFIRDLVRESYLTLLVIKVGTKLMPDFVF